MESKVWVALDGCFLRPAPKLLIEAVSGITQGASFEIHLPGPLPPRPPFLIGERQGPESVCIVKNNNNNENLPRGSQGVTV